MVVGHQNVNGSHALTTPFSSIVCHIRGIALATINLSTKYEIPNFTHYEDIKGNTKY